LTPEQRISISDPRLRIESQARISYSTLTAAVNHHTYHG
jgi:hypothetical protein